MRAIYTAKNGLISQQERIDTIGNNLANVNTTGFKSTRIDFQDCLYQTIGRVIQPQDDMNMQMGHGTIVGASTMYFTQGKLLQSGLNTDIAIEGDGFFAVQTPSGQVQYTRDSHFSVDVDGSLVANDGSYLLDTEGNRITGLDSNFVCETNGNIVLDGQVVATVGIFDCQNQMALTPSGGNRYVESENSGAMELQTQGYDLRQGVYESSNVDLATEMSNLVRAQRALSLSSRALTTADEMESQAINIRR